jgi:hypothetical protein
VTSTDHLSSSRGVNLLLLRPAYEIYLQFESLRSMSLLWHHVNPVSKEHAPLISEEIYNLTVEYATVLDDALHHQSPFTTGKEPKIRFGRSNDMQ